MLDVVAIQLDTRWHQPAMNHGDVRRILQSVRPAPGSLIVLPEMFDVGFSMNLDAAVDRRDANTPAFLAGVARETGTTVVAGFAERDGDGHAVNQAAMFGPDGERIASYVKCHGFSPAGEPEKYRNGAGPIVVDCWGIRFAPLICYDLRFPELFRAATKQGAEVFVVIANWPAARIEHWVALTRARAIENLAYVIAVNRCGSDPQLAYPGQSMVIDPKGNVIARAGDGPEALQARIDVGLVRSWRREFPALRDARFW